MRTVTLALAFATLAAAAGCGAKDPCSGESGTCLTLLLDGNVTLDQLNLSVGDPINRSVLTPNPPRTIHLPAQVALVFPSGTSGSATLDIDALAAGAIVAHDERSITLGGHSTVSATLTAGTTPPPDMSSTSGGDDLAGGVADDLSGVVQDLSGVVQDLSGVTIHDLSMVPVQDLSCGNTATDASNCGTCGHSCLGGTCAGGVCQPYTLATLGSGGSHMVTDGTTLYLRDSFNIYSCPLPTCTGGKVSLASTTAGGNFGDVAINPAGTRLFFAEFSASAPGDFRTCTLPGCGAASIKSVVSSPSVNIYSLGADANNVYWTDATTVWSASTGGSFPATQVTLASNGNGARDIVSDGVNAWWSNTAGNTSGAGSIAKCAVGGCAGASALVVTNLSGPIQTHIFGSKLYWLNFNAQTVGDCPLNNCTTATSLTFLDSTQLYYPWGIASDGTNLFIGKRADNKLLGTCALPDCSGAFTAMPINVNDDPKGVIVTASAIYWLAGSGAVMGWAR